MFRLQRGQRLVRSGRIMARGAAHRRDGTDVEHAPNERDEGGEACCLAVLDAAFVEITGERDKHRPYALHSLGQHREACQGLPMPLGMDARVGDMKVGRVDDFHDALLSGPGAKPLNTPFSWSSSSFWPSLSM